MASANNNVDTMKCKALKKEKKNNLRRNFNEFKSIVFVLCKKFPKRSSIIQGYHLILC